MSITPTAEQVAVIDAARDTEDNLLISALAGAAKTTTLEMIAHELASTSMLCLAFNKRIADEMSTRLPDNCKAMTLNSLGHRAWGETIGRYLRINPRKNYELLREEVDKLSGEDKTLAFEEFSDTLKSIAFGKSCGYIPDNHKTKNKRLIGDADLYAHLEYEPSDLQFDLIKTVSEKSLILAHAGTCDYDDQLLMPTVFTSLMPRYPLVLIDEAQDLSSLNHQMLTKLVRKRLIAVGDECQSIYGFRGAHEESMQLLKREFSMREFFLSISFRCPRAIVREAQWRAPHMTWPDWAKDGTVLRHNEWDTNDIPEEATILCRNNAPLFAMAIKLLRAGRLPQLIGGDIGRHLIRLMKKLGPAEVKTEKARLLVKEWEEKKCEKARDPGKVKDQAACMLIFLSQGTNLGEAIAYAEHLFARQGPIQLSTGHKSKGLEFNNVLILDSHLVRMQQQQDRNLMYVMQTRAKQTLAYVDTENFDDGEEA